MSKTTINLKLHQLPAELDELDLLVEDLAGWEYPADDADPDVRLVDSLEREQLQAEINRRAAEFFGNLHAKGRQIHGWLCRLKADSDAANEELKRLRKVAKTRENKLQRVKDYTRDALLALGLKRVEEGDWRLRVQANGGVLPLEWDRITPVPPALAAPISVDPALLVLRFRDVLANYPARALSDEPDEALLRALGIEPASLEPSLERVRAQIKADDGIVPDGFSLHERGHHLRVE